MNEFKVGDRVRMIWHPSFEGVIVDLCEQRGCYCVLWDVDENPELHVASWWVERIDE